METGKRLSLFPYGDLHMETGGVSIDSHMEMVIQRLGMCQHLFPYDDPRMDTVSHIVTILFLAPFCVILKSHICTYVDSTKGMLVCQKGINGTIWYDSLTSMQAGKISDLF